MCGVVGIISKNKVAVQIHDLLMQLQHRGQDAAGIITADDKFHIKIGSGLVRDVFDIQDMHSLDGNLGIGHVRYPTSGTLCEQEAQPFWIGSPYGIAMAHNGQLTNYEQLASYLKNEKRRHLNTESDSETLIHLLACSLEEQDDILNSDGSELNSELNPKQEQMFFQQLIKAVRNIMVNAKGSYSVVSSIIGKGLIAFRDPFGIRPLVIGKKILEDGFESTVIASENSGFYSLGYEQVDDVQAGELFYIASSGNSYRETIITKDFRPCMFEIVYFSRPDSKIDDISVYRARLRLGQNLAQSWQEQFSHLPVDVVIPVPFTSNTSALSFATKLGVRYSEGLYKNAFIGRTFIMPDDKARKRSVKFKLSPQVTEIKDKHIILVDDSIVRGTTSKEIVKMVKEAGAKSVYLVSTCPELKFPCKYGIDIPTKEELIAHRYDLTQLQKYIGVDALLYQTHENLVEAISRRGKHQINKPCMACLDGEYFENQ